MLASIILNSQPAFHGMILKASITSKLSITSTASYVLEFPSIFDHSLLRSRRPFVLSARFQKNVRKAYTDLQRSNYTIVSHEHVHHCLDTLFQDVTCLADDTPMPTAYERHQIGNHQIRQCRNMDKLVAWTQASERHACFRMLSDYRRVPHTLEQFAFCNSNSQYRPIMEAYFEKYGHQDPYSD